MDGSISGETLAAGFAIEVDRKAFREAVGRIAPFRKGYHQWERVIELRSSSDGLRILAGGSGLSACLTIPGTARGAGAVVVDCGALRTMLPLTSSGPMRLEDDPRGLAITFDGVRTVCHKEPLDQMPTTGLEGELPDMLDIDAAGMLALLERTRFAMSRDEKRFNLNSLFLEASGQGDLIGVATDGHRLATCRIDEGFEACEGDVLVPAELVDALNAFLRRAKGLTTLGFTVAKRGNDQRIFFRVGFTTLSMPVHEGPFPAWRHVVPKHAATRFAVDRFKLWGVVKQMGKAARGVKGGPQIAIERAGEELVVSAQNPETGESSCRLPCRTFEDGHKQGHRSAYNAEYLADALMAFETEEVVLHYVDELSPIKITHPDEDGHEQVIMPIQM